MVLILMLCGFSGCKIQALFFTSDSREEVEVVQLYIGLFKRELEAAISCSVSTRFADLMV